MGMTNREIQVWNEIGEWEQKLYQYEPTDLTVMYDKWLEQSFSLLPEDVRIRFFAKMDTMLFHLHALVQSSQIQMDAREQNFRSSAGL